MPTVPDAMPRRPSLSSHSLCSEALFTARVGSLRQVRGAQAVFARESRRLALKRVFGVLVDELRDDAGPTGLMARAQALAGVAVEILVEQDEIAPMRVGRKFGALAVDGAMTVLVLEEETDQAP